MADGIFGRYPPAKWEVEGAAPVTFPVQQIEEGGGNRLVGHARLYRDGERVDDTGGQATVWMLETPFFNSASHEEGVDGLSQYPDNVNALIEACRIHETGTLTVPTVGPRRCRAETWRRVERFDSVDMAIVRITWKEDNEDDADAAAAQAPSASAVASKYAKDVADAADELGNGEDVFESISNAADEVTDLMNAPSEYAADIDAKVGNTVADIERVQDTFDKQTQAAGDELSALLTDPSSSRALRTLAKLKDVVARAPVQKHDKQGAKIVSRTFDTDLSIFAVASAVGQSASKLIPLNAGLPDLLHIPAGTPVRVYAKATA